MELFTFEHIINGKEVRMVPGNEEEKGDYQDGWRC